MTTPHNWFNYLNKDNYRYCWHCGVIENTTNTNSTCRGKVNIKLRKKQIKCDTTKHHVDIDKELLKLEQQVKDYIELTDMLLSKFHGRPAYNHLKREIDKVSNRYIT